MNGLDAVDLSDLSLWASRMGAMGHVVFNDRHAAALQKLAWQIRYENPAVVTACSMNYLLEPASVDR